MGSGRIASFRKSIRDNDQGNDYSPVSCIAPMLHANLTSFTNASLAMVGYSICLTRRSMECDWSLAADSSQKISSISMHTRNS